MTPPPGSTSVSGTGSPVAGNRHATEQSFGQFFLPGPTEVHPDVLAAMLQPMIPHRGGEMVQLLTAMEAPLQRAWRTARRVFVGTCSATGFMEMAVRSGVRRRALSLVGGAFGERFAGIVAATGRDVVRVDVPLGNTIEPDMLRDALKRTEVDAVTLVHSETSTGALAPLQELASVVRDFDGVVLLVDAVTSFAGLPVETDAWELDFVLAGSQKALALPPGLALAVASERMIERAKQVPERGAYFDLLAYDRAAMDYQPTNTPAVSLLYALEAQLRRIDADGGIEGRWNRHRRMQQMVEGWVGARGGELGYRFLPPKDRRSWTVSCLKVPDEKSGRAVAGVMKSKGWVIGSGYGPLKQSTIRIGHMGDHRPERLADLLETLESVAL